VGAERHREDPHPRPGHNPKLTLAGRLDGFVNGRPVSLVADGDTVTLVPGSTSTLLALIRLRRSWRHVADLPRQVLGRTNIRLYVRVGWFGRVQLLPDTSPFFRLFLPST
jgi:hypothetical protein